MEVSSKVEEMTMTVFGLTVGTFQFATTTSQQGSTTTTPATQRDLYTAANSIPWTLEPINY
jgi:hypothetical protein